MTFLAVVAGVLASAGVLFATRWLRTQYRDFCELRQWALAVMAETAKVREQQAGIRQKRNAKAVRETR